LFRIFIVAMNDNNRQSFHRSSIQMNGPIMRNNYHSVPRKLINKTRHNSISKTEHLNFK
jgi:hypothetical protein